MASIWSFLQQTAAASAAAALLLFLRYLFRDQLSPRCQCILWGVLVLRLLTPAGWTGPALDLRFPIDWGRTAAELRLASAYSSPYTADMPRLPIPLFPAGMPRSVTDWLFLLYLAGVAACLLRLLWGRWRLGRFLRAAETVADLSPIQAVADTYHLRMPRRVVAAAGLRAPFLTGVLTPTLVLPAGEEADRSVLLHELLHLRQKDVAWGWLEGVLRCIHWPNPLLRYALRQMADDRERRCDQAVLERLEGEDRRTYGRLLLAFADSALLPGTTSIANGARQIKARVETIARFRRFPREMELAAVCMALVLALSLGVPVRAELKEGDRAAGTAQVISMARRTRPTTPAGALDTYAKALYREKSDPEEALFYHMMALPEADREDFIRQYGERSPLCAYTAGPYVHSLVPEGEGWLCQVTYFQNTWDAEYPRVGYRSHTVTLQPEGDYWTVRELSFQDGALYPEGEDWAAQYNDLAEQIAPALPATAAWTGEAAGISVRLEPVNRLHLAGAPYGQTWLNQLFPNMRETGFLPQLNERYTWGTLAWRAVAVDQTGQNRPFRLLVLVLDAEGQPVTSSQQLQTSFHFKNTGPAETLFFEGGTLFNRGGGGASSNSLEEMRHIFGQYGYKAVLTIDGVDYPLSLRREETAP